MIKVLVVFSKRFLSVRSKELLEGNIHMPKLILCYLSYSSFHLGEFHRLKITPIGACHR